MQATSSDAQVTQSGQAIAINNTTCAQLIELFAPMLGPSGSIKALVSGGQQLNLTKDGNSLCRDVQFTHPTSILITRAATSLYNSIGDGTISFVLLCCECFTEAYKLICDGSSIPNIINSLQLALKDVSECLRANAIPLDDKNLRALVHTSLNTKIRNPDFLVDIVIKAIVSISATKNFDTNMIEVIKMEEGDIRDSEFIDGLVLDHGPRHHAMPTKYEKPEINAEFFYNSAEQRDMLCASEREFISKKAKDIASFAIELQKEGKSLLVVSEKGIDQISLEILSEANVLALRRAKRRNLERLVNMCGDCYSEEIGIIAKPGPKAYRFVTKHLQIKDSTTVVFFDDSLKNIKAAQSEEFKWITYHVTPENDILSDKINTGERRYAGSKTPTTLPLRVTKKSSWHKWYPPIFLASESTLTKIQLDNCGINDKFMIAILKLRNLEELQMNEVDCRNQTDNKFDSSHPEIKDKLLIITKLEVTNASMEFIPESISQLKNLKEILISKNSMTEENFEKTIRNLQPLEFLETLSFSECKIEEILDSQNVKKESNKIEEPIKEGPNLKSLKHLRLEYCGLTKIP
ncbi:T-complex protein 1 subunit zeta-like, partial [Arctopsyche grandis]|uniref:T-complex protein 1 subunit zeta-like n=1 Tax=Arctopsyche grandis TaxID=121162 RepID=UPI00406D977B